MDRRRDLRPAHQADFSATCPPWRSLMSRTAVQRLWKARKIGIKVSSMGLPDPRGDLLEIASGDYAL